MIWLLEQSSHNSEAKASQYLFFILRGQLSCRHQEFLYNCKASKLFSVFVFGKGPPAHKSQVTHKHLAGNAREMLLV